MQGILDIKVVTGEWVKIGLKYRNCIVKGFRKSNSEGRINRNGGTLLFITRKRECELNNLAVLPINLLILLLLVQVAYIGIRKYVSG